MSMPMVTCVVVSIIFVYFATSATDITIGIVIVVFSSVIVVSTRSVFSFTQISPPKYLLGYGVRM